MGIKLIYHKNNGGLSPFDEAIREVSRTHHLRLVCPYIGPRYIESLIQGITRFELLTDVPEWLRTFPGQRQDIAAFIKSNQTRVRHLDGVHAKVAIGHRQAFFGSSNLTRRGLTSRIELSLLLDDEELRAELEQWFDALWQEAEPVSLDELEQTVTTLEAAPKQHVPLLRMGRGKATLKGKLLPIGRKVAVPATSLFASLLGQFAQLSLPSAELRVRQQVRDWLYEKLAAEGQTTFKEALSHFRHNEPEATVRDIFEAAVADCGNYPGTLMYPNNAAVSLWTGNAFVPFDLDAARASCAKVDGFLAWLIERLSPDEFQPIPDWQAACAHFGVPIRSAQQLLRQMHEVGFLDSAQEGWALTGEGPWASIKERLPHAAAAWLRKGLSLDTGEAQKPAQEDRVQTSRPAKPALEPVQKKPSAPQTSTLDGHMAKLIRLLAVEALPADVNALLWKIGEGPGKRQQNRKAVESLIRSPLVRAVTLPDGQPGITLDLTADVTYRLTPERHPLALAAWKDALNNQ